MTDLHPFGTRVRHPQNWLKHSTPSMFEHTKQAHNRSITIFIFMKFNMKICDRIFTYKFVINRDSCFDFLDLFLILLDLSL